VFPGEDHDTLNVRVYFHDTDAVVRPMKHHFNVKSEILMEDTSELNRLFDDERHVRDVNDLIRQFMFVETCVSGRISVCVDVREDSYDICFGMVRKVSSEFLQCYVRHFDRLNMLITFVAGVFTVRVTVFTKKNDTSNKRKNAHADDRDDTSKRRDTRIKTE
jgi:hypothetical protein